MVVCVAKGIPGFPEEVCEAQSVFHRPDDKHGSYILTWSMTLDWTSVLSLDFSAWGCTHIEISADSVKLHEIWVY